HDIEIAMDGERLTLVTAGGREEFMKMAENPGTFGTELDKRLTVTLPVKAGVHTLWATTVLRSHAVRDDLIKPFLRTTVDGLDIAGDPSVDRLSIEGPFQAKGADHNPSRARIFTCRPVKAAEELPCARKILSTLAHRAYRRPLQESDLEQLLSFYQRKRNNQGNFEQGIESALQLILASPEFLFRFEADPADLPAEAVYHV